jgi:hypothetical protein
MNAAVVQIPAFGLFGWPRNYLLLGMPLLDSMPPAEALAVVAHEYGHLAGAHSWFAAYIYRMRRTWSIVSAYTDHIKGWLGKLASPMVSWYAPYFNAYTFVLARANEYQADAASAELVGVDNAVQALKRVNTVGQLHQDFLHQTFERMAFDAAPPADLMVRWADRASRGPASADAQRWLGEALDRKGHFSDSHPTLRARLAALSAADPTREPAALDGEIASQVWLGPLAQTLRDEFQGQWAAEVAKSWSERHEVAKQEREKLQELRVLSERTSQQQIELLSLTSRLEPEIDLRFELANFNADNPDHVLGMLLEASARLSKGEHEGIAMLERLIKIDPESTKTACERAYAFLREHKANEEAQVWATRWRTRDELETLRDQQLRSLTPKDPIAPHGLDDLQVAAFKSQLTADVLVDVEEVFLARRVIAADPSVFQLILGVQVSRDGQVRGMQRAVVIRLNAVELPMRLLILTLDGEFESMGKKFRALDAAKLF